MKLLKIIKDKDVPKDKSKLLIREASRAVLFDDKGLIPLLFVSKFGYHKLPGGGIEPDEDKIGALRREIKEEVGSEIEITRELGKIIEFRSEIDLEQTSFCYLGRIISKGKPDFTEEEIENGLQLVWASLNDAIFKVEQDQPKDYSGSFIQQRDLEFLKQAKKYL